VDATDPMDITMPENSLSTRGLGHWRWKPELVMKALRELRKDEIGLWYLDAGCSVFSGPREQASMRRYFEFGTSNPYGLFFQLEYPYTDANYSKRRVAEHLCASETDLRSGQFQATAFFVRNTPEAFELIEEWVGLSRKGWPFDDNNNEATEFSDAFGGHRHDQSVLSLLLKSRGYLGVPDELNVNRLELLRHLRECNNERPLVATRHRSYFSDLGMNPLSRALRGIQSLI
jgi:hypothetical protein